MFSDLERTTRFLLVAPVLAVLFLFNGSEPPPWVAIPDIFAPEYDSSTPEPKSNPVVTPVVVNTPKPIAVSTPAVVDIMDIMGVQHEAWLNPPLISEPVPVTGAIGGAESMLLTAEDWKEWPVLPAYISEEMRRLYQEGLRKGTDPTAFSIIGDCQSQPEEFLGIFDTDPRSLANLPAPLQETARNFAGNFGRYSPTIRDGITAGAVLWNEWANNYHRGQVCKANENPLSCELRVNNPSIVFIHIGTHWEARNHRYLTLIVEMIKEHGAVPVMVTKADNREGDERINYQTVQVAEELGVPVWNFWASVQHTPNNGLEDNSAMYLNHEAAEIHRYSALQVLDLVWRAVR
jgi:hypothetical protein